jgi:hypothetical protein
MGPYIKRGDSLTQEEKASRTGRKSLDCSMLCGPLNRWQLCTAKDTKRERQQLSGETKKLIGKPKQAAFIGGQTSTSLMTALFPCPLSEWDPWYTLQEQAWLKTEGGNFPLDEW